MIPGKFLLFTSLTVFLHLIIMDQPAVAENTPLVALVNQKIKTADSIVIVEKVVAYPNEKSITGPGRKYYGKSVEMDYGKGPIVIFKIEKSPDYPQEMFQPWDWIHIDLFSNGKKLRESGGGGLGDDGKTRVAHFSFFVETDMDPLKKAVELEKLGQLKLKITLFKIEKIFDLPFKNLPTGKIPVYEDKNVQIIDTKWEEKWNKGQKKNYTILKVGFKNKTKLASYFLVVKPKGSKGPGSKSTSGGSNHLRFRISKRKTDLSSAQFWGIIPVAEKIMAPEKLKPQ